MTQKKGSRKKTTKAKTPKPEMIISESQAREWEARCPFFAKRASAQQLADAGMILIVSDDDLRALL